MDPKWVHMEAEGGPNGGLGAKPPEKGPLGPIGPYQPLLAVRDTRFLGQQVTRDYLLSIEASKKSWKEL